MQTTSSQQALDHTNILYTDLCPVKQPILSAHRHHLQCSLQMVGIDRGIGIKAGLELLMALYDPGKTIRTRPSYNRVDIL